MRTEVEGSSLSGVLSPWTGEFASEEEEQRYRVHQGSRTRRCALAVLGIGSLGLMWGVRYHDIYYDNWEWTAMPLRAAVALLGVAIFWRIQKDKARWQHDSDMVLFAAAILSSVSVILFDQMVAYDEYGYLTFWRGLYLMMFSLLAFVALPIPYRLRVALSGTFVVVWTLVCNALGDPATAAMSVGLFLILGYAGALVRHVNTLQRRHYLATRSEQHQRRILERASQELQQAQRQLLLREKMASVGMLSAGVAHEISQPAELAHAGAQAVKDELVACRLGLARRAEAASTDAALGLAPRLDALQVQISTVVQGTGRVRTLARNLQSLSRREPVDQFEADLAAVLERAAAATQWKFQGAVVVQVLPGSRPLIAVAVAEIEEALLHLLDNACEAVVRRQANAPELAPGTVTICAKGLRETLELTVEDTGAGMSANAQEHAFEPFFTTKPAGDGAGLGLTIAFEIAKRCGGDIALSSIEDVGTRVTLRLPLPRSDDGAVWPRAAFA